MGSIFSYLRGFLIVIEFESLIDASGVSVEEDDIVFDLEMGDVGGKIFF
jgi:hypothetical protein